jgi:hypothetical protein
MPGMNLPVNPNYSKYVNCDNVADVCFDKPVIYFYTNKVINNVSVRLNIPGQVTDSIPLYPDSGWNNLTVIPGGTIEYQNNKYSELYYETSVTKHIIPTTGYVISTANLNTKLDELITKLGLIPAEKQEFLAYWLPKLNELNTPYVFVGILTPQQKESVDGILVSPQPDTTIEFLTYFKGLTLPYFPTPPVLPQVPQRKGFTMVEWGGSIDH